MSARAQEALLDRLRGFHVSAHRGGYLYDDSNTIARFEKARLQGTDIIETDLQVSSDGVPFLFHDPSLQPATRCQGLFSDATARDIEHCALSGLDHGPEPFEAALQWSRGRVVIDAEMKTGRAIRPAIDLVRQYQAYDWTYLEVGGDPAVYEEARAYDARIVLEVVPQGPDGQSDLDKLLTIHDPHLIVQLHPGLATSANLERLRSRGILTSANAFSFGMERRRTFWPLPRTAACDEIYRLKINIAVTNAPEPCVAQRVVADLAAPKGARGTDPMPRSEIDPRP